MAESQARTSRKGKRKRGMGIYMKNIITRKVTLPFRILGSNITETIQDKLSQMIEGHCEKEGYIKPSSTSIVNYSAGCLNAENVSEFNKEIVKYTITSPGLAHPLPVKWISFCFDFRKKKKKYAGVK